MFPLDILPHGFAQVLFYTPFPYQLYFPVAIYMGKVTGMALLQGLIVQTAWVLLAYGFAELMWHRGIRKYSAVGG